MSKQTGGNTDSKINPNYKGKPENYNPDFNKNKESESVDKNKKFKSKPENLSPKFEKREKDIEKKKSYNKKKSYDKKKYDKDSRGDFDKAQESAQKYDSSTYFYKKPSKKPQPPPQKMMSIDIYGPQKPAKKPFNNFGADANRLGNLQYFQPYLYWGKTPKGTFIQNITLKSRDDHYVTGRESFVSATIPKEVSRSFHTIFSRRELLEYIFNVLSFSSKVIQKGCMNKCDSVNVSNYIKFIDSGKPINLDYDARRRQRAYCNLDPNSRIYRGCYPRGTESSNWQCAKGSVGIHIRVYKLKQSDINLFLIETDEEKSKLESNIYRDFHYYEIIRSLYFNTETEKRKCPHFIQMYKTFHCDDSNDVFKTETDPECKKIDGLSIGGRLFPTRRTSTGGSNKIINSQNTKLQNIKPQSMHNFSLRYTQQGGNSKTETLIILTEAPKYPFIDWVTENTKRLDHYKYLGIKSGVHTEKVWMSIMFQIWFTLLVLTERDPTKDNAPYLTFNNISYKHLWIQEVKEGGYWLYEIDGVEYFVPNWGYIILFDLPPNIGKTDNDGNLDDCRVFMSEFYNDVAESQEEIKKSKEINNNMFKRLNSSLNEDLFNLKSREDGVKSSSELSKIKKPDEKITDLIGKGINLNTTPPQDHKLIQSKIKELIKSNFEPKYGSRVSGSIVEASYQSSLKSFIDSIYVQLVQFFDIDSVTSKKDKDNIKKIINYPTKVYYNDELLEKDNFLNIIQQYYKGKLMIYQEKINPLTYRWCIFEGILINSSGDIDKTKCKLSGMPSGTYFDVDQLFIPKQYPNIKVNKKFYPTGTKVSVGNYIEKYSFPTF